MSGNSGVSLNWGGFDKAIANASKKLSNTRLLMGSIGEALVAGTVRRFVDEKDPQGNSWEPSGRASAEGGKTLTDTGRLRSSIDYAATPSKVMVGSNIIYARIHQLGGKAGKGHKVKIPARPYLGISQTDMDEVRAIMSDFITGVFK